MAWNGSISAGTADGARAGGCGIGRVGSIFNINIKGAEGWENSACSWRNIKTVIMVGAACMAAKPAAWASGGHQRRQHQTQMASKRRP